MMYSVIVIWMNIVVILEVVYHSSAFLYLKKTESKGAFVNGLQFWSVNFTHTTRKKILIGNFSQMFKLLQTLYEFNNDLSARKLGMLLCPICLSVFISKVMHS